MKDTWWVNKKELDDDQLELIDIGVEGSYLVQGPPGSGKSNLLLLRANYLAKSNNPDIVVLVFTNSLERFLREGAAGYDFDTEKIVTFNKWARRFLHNTSSSKINIPNGFSDARKTIFEELVKVVESKKINQIFDTIMLDEGQDYLPHELEFLRSICNNFFIVADSKQKIYSGRDSIETAKELVDEVKILNFHYRSGKKICTVADEIGKYMTDYTPMLPTCHYDEEEYTSETTLCRYDNLDKLVESLIDRLNNQLIAYPNSNIAVLCPTNKDLSDIWSKIQHHQISELFSTKTKEGVLEFKEDVRIYMCTIHSAKGLEFRAVHLINAENLSKFRENIHELAFVSVTRSKTSFTAHHIKPIPGFFEGAMKKAEPVNKPSLDELFGN